MPDSDSPRYTDDLLAIAAAVILLVVSFAAVWTVRPAADSADATADITTSVTSPLKPWLAKPAKWTNNAAHAFFKPGTEDSKPKKNSLQGVLGVYVCIGLIVAVAMQLQSGSGVRFLIAFVPVFLLATLAYVLAGQSLVKGYNLEYALWAIGVGLLISNTIGTPSFVKPAVLTEFYIKTGLVLLGAEVLMSRLLALGIPGIFVAWVVTPIVLIST